MFNSYKIQPIKPIIKGNKKLKKPGKNEVIFIEKNELKKHLKMIEILKIFLNINSY